MVQIIPQFVSVWGVNEVLRAVEEGKPAREAVFLKRSVNLVS